MPLSQQARTLAVTTPLGEDVLLLRAMRGSERLGTLFEYQLELISKSVAIKHEDLLGQPATVRLELPGYQTRYFNGIVSRFSHTGFDGSLAIYQATLVPWFWLLSRTTDCRIFQDQTVPEIVKEIFREHGYIDFQEFLVEPHHRRNYCVQYRETDFAFISRLLEQEGIHYFFRHEHDRHTLVLADDNGAHLPIAGYEEIPYYPPDETALRERDHISGWSVAGAVQSGAYTYTDFDCTAPRKELLIKRHHPHERARVDLERYDYPGGYTQHDQGHDWVRARIEELHVDYETVKGSGNARGLATGARFKLTKYPRDDQNREYLLLSADYQLRSDVFGSVGTANTGPVFHCEFTALDAKTPYRPPRNTPKARVQGPQTAIVVGKAGEELWTDQYGRVKVQFRWDRYGQSDEQSSCWVRVAHPWAGKNWGAVAIPRIGQEVIVDFLEGDPDRPIITGRVYNGVNKPPYKLPGAAAISGLMSNSTKGGGGYNEYIMDDTKGQELIREHGQFDKDSTIEHDLREHVLNDRSRDVTNNETIQIGKDRTKTIGSDETTSIGHDRKETVANNETINIGHDRNQTVVNNETISVGSNRTDTVGANQTLSIGANRTEKVGGNETVTIAASKSETIAAAKAESIGAAKALSIGAAYQVSVGGVMNTSVGGAKLEEVGLYSMQAIGGNLSVKVGNNTAHSTADEHTISATEIHLTGKSKITLSVGASTITLTPALIEIKGPLVKINC